MTRFSNWRFTGPGKYGRDNIAFETLSQFKELDVYVNRDQPPPSPTEMARRLERDRALQHWHTHPIAMPFEQWFAVGGRAPSQQPIAASTKGAP
jgi:hypothetical protein